MTINIKDCFESRWRDGYIVEFDFSQLEVIGAAIVSGDPMMKKDILDGIDSHSQSAAWLNPMYTYEQVRTGYLAGEPLFEKMRKNAKAPRFELQYGAGASSIARNNGLSIEAAKGFIERYYERYSVLKQFQLDLRMDVEASIKPSTLRTRSGYPLGIGKWQSVTGRVYSFTEQEAPKFLQDRGQMTSISPTQIANYPMQGFATGDVVPEMLGRIHRRIADEQYLYSSVLPVNTIHDSILFDVRDDDVLHYAVPIIRDVMSNVPLAMRERFGLHVDMPFNVDVEYGHYWSNMSAYK